MKSSSALDTTVDTPTGGERPFLHRGMRLPFILIVSCFAAWGVLNNMTDPLVSVFSSVFSMGAFQASLVQFAFYGAYCVLAIPAAWINSQLGYKGGVLIGLLLASFGGFLFFPASQVMTYSMFLVALFTLAAGLIMAIVGGALVPLLHGWVIDISSAQLSYLVVTFCFAVVAAYGIYVLRTGSPAAVNEDAA